MIHQTSFWYYSRKKKKENVGRGQFSVLVLKNRKMKVVYYTMIKVYTIYSNQMNSGPKAMLGQRMNIFLSFFRVEQIMMDIELTDPKFVELLVTETNFSKHSMKLWESEKSWSIIFQGNII